jgi:large subunit ribosomal protein L32e
MREGNVMAPTFLRRTSFRYSKLGKRRKKKQIWRRPTGRDNKMREKRKGYPAVVSVGYRTNKKEQKNFVNVENMKDFGKVQEGDIIVLGNIGMKRKIEIAKFAKEKKIEISNLNVEKFLKNVEKKDKKRKEEVEKAKAKVEKSKKEKKKDSAGADKVPKSVPRETSGEVSTKGKEINKENAASESKVDDKDKKENAEESK